MCVCVFVFACVCVFVCVFACVCLCDGVRYLKGHFLCVVFFRRASESEVSLRQGRLSTYREVEKKRFQVQSTLIHERRNGGGWPGTFPIFGGARLSGIDGINY